MSDDSSDRRDSSPTTASFEEWLDQQAESQDISRQELFERLVSSYWTLNELVQLLDDSGNTTSLADIYPGDGSDPPDGEGAGAAPMIGGSGADSDEDRRRDRDRQERRRRDREDRSRTREETAELRTQLEELHDRIDDLESELGDERERGQSQDGLIEALADRLSGIKADLSELESESASGRESLSSNQAALERRLDGLEADLTDLEGDLDGRQKQLASEQERLRSRLNSEFDELETILRYLVSQTDDLDAGLATVEQRHDEALSQLQWERSAMRSLLREASAHDAHVGECETCGADIDLDLLAEPYCSECDSLLTGIEEHDKWLFFSDIVVTAEETPAAGENRAASSTGPHPSEPEPTPDPSGPHNTAAGRGAESSGMPTEVNARRTGSQANDAEPMRSTADKHGDRSAPDHDPHSSPVTDDTSEGSDAPMFDLEADDPEPESGPSPGPDLDAGTDTDAVVSEDEESRSAFSFGGAASDPGSSSDRDDEPDSDADGAEEAPDDSPFGDLDDLKQKEESDDE